MDNKSKIRNIFIFLTFGVLIVNLLCCGINVSVAESGALFIPLVTSKNSRETGFTDYTGFGVTITVYESEDDNDEIDPPKLVANTETYNKIAGTIESWNGEMTLGDYNAYKEDLIQVNGIIVNSEMHEDYIVYTFANENKLRVDFISNKSKEYEHEVASGAEPINVEIGEETLYQEYENGVVVIIYAGEYLVSERVPLKFTSNFYIDSANFLITFFITLCIAYAVAIICIKFSQKKNITVGGNENG